MKAPSPKDVLSGAEVFLNVGSIEGDVVRVGVYERTGGMLMTRRGWIRLRVSDLGELSLQLQSVARGTWES